MGKKKKTEKQGKKPHRNKPTSKKYTKYVITGETIKRSQNCPRCGPGTFLMTTSNRKYCGKCHYTEFISKNKQQI